VTAARWPADYVALDRGRVMVHPEYVGAFFERGWRTLDAVMDAEVEVVRKVEARDNCRLQFAGKPAYLKRHWERRASPLTTPPGRREADAVGWCQAAGASTMTVIAAGAEGGARDRRSFFLSEAIGGIAADEFWNANPDRQVRAEVIAALAETAQRFHAAHLFHRDFYWCHFFIRDEGQRITAHLIDLQRILRRPWMEWRWHVKDLGQFWFSAPDGVTADDRRAWFEIYSGGERRGAMEWAARLRARFYQIKDGRAA